MRRDQAREFRGTLGLDRRGDAREVQVTRPVLTMVVPSVWFNT